MFVRRAIGAREAVAARVPVVFPVHPRTRQRIGDLAASHPRTRFIEPLTYLPFLGLQRHCAVVVTDSGGVQEESTYLGVP